MRALTFVGIIPCSAIATSSRSRKSRWSVGRLLPGQQQVEVLGEAEPAHQVAAQVAAAHLDPVGVGLADVADGLAHVGFISQRRTLRACHGCRVPSRVRVLRRVVVVAVVVLQLLFIARGYWSDHKEFAFQMFPESSRWRADIVRVTADGRRVPIERPWSGYRWDELVRTAGLRYPAERHHADAGLDNQLAFLDAALDWVARQHPARRRDALPRGEGHLLAQRRPAPGRESSAKR